MSLHNFQVFEMSPLRGVVVDLEAAVSLKGEEEVFVCFVVVVFFFYLGCSLLPAPWHSLHLASSADWRLTCFEVTYQNAQLQLLPHYEIPSRWYHVMKK